MSKNKPGDIEVKAFATHHVILQPNPFRRALRRVADDDRDDPVGRAEKALAGLSGEFKNWMTIEADRLSAAWDAIGSDGFTDATRGELFRAAHDIKGEAATFGYPAVAPVADSLCRLLEHTPDIERIPLALVEQHVDAARAIAREHARADRAGMASALTKRLRDVTDEFLRVENVDRPDYLESIFAPPLVPGAA